MAPLLLVCVIFSNVVTQKICSNEFLFFLQHLKFCTIEATSVGLSRHFKIGGVPAILTYKGGELLTRLVTQCYLMIWTNTRLISTKIARLEMEHNIVVITK